MNWLIIFCVITSNILETIAYKNKNEKLNTHDRTVYSCGTEAPEHRICYTLDIENDLSSGDKLKPPNNSLFFIESSCRGGLNGRQACSVESAARAHKNRSVIVLFTGPVFKQCLKYGALKALRTYENIKFYRIHLTEYSKQTPLESDLSVNIWRNISEQSDYPITHTSDVLKYLTLHKFGGVYLDLDVIVVKPLRWLTNSANWVAKEESEKLGSAFVAFGNDQSGKRITQGILWYLKNTLKYDHWEYNGNGVLTKVMEDICHTTRVSRMSAAKCLGVKIFPMKYFYPIPHENYDEYFECDPDFSVSLPFIRKFRNSSKPKEELSSTSKKLKIYLKDAVAFHIWNKFTQDESICKESLYGQLVQKYCPRVNKMYDNSKELLKYLKD